MECQTSKFFPVLLEVMEKYAFAPSSIFNAHEMEAPCGIVKRKVCSIRVKWLVDIDIRKRGCNVALIFFINANGQYICVCGSVTTAWRVLRLWMEGQPPI